VVQELTGQAAPDAATSAWLLDVRTAVLDKLMSSALPTNCKASSSRCLHVDTLFLLLVTFTGWFKLVGDPFA
jgi:hypothetical protein